MKKSLLIYPLVCLLLLSCDNAIDEPAGGDKVLARVHGKYLYASDLDGMYPTNSTKEDSTKVTNAMVDRWIRTTLMQHQAERNLPEDYNIDKKVQDYRASLLVHNYELQIVNEELDSTITKEELLEYYSKHKNHFQLETNIMRAKFVKIPTDAPDKEKLESWWKSDNKADFAQLVKYCNQYATVFSLEDTIWHSVDAVAAEFPKGTFSSKELSGKKSLKLEEGNYFYLLKVYEIQSRNSEPPLSYVRMQASKHILHLRKEALIKQKRNQLFDKEFSKGNVKIFE